MRVMDLVIFFEYINFEMGRRKMNGYWSFFEILGQGKGIGSGKGVGEGEI